NLRALERTTNFAVAAAVCERRPRTARCAPWDRRIAQRSGYSTNKTAAARVCAAAEFCMEETLTSLAALLDNSLIDSLPLAVRGESFQAEHSLSESARPAA